MGAELFAEITSASPTTNLRHLRALVAVARIADDHTRIAHAADLRAANVGGMLVVASNDRALVYIKKISDTGLLDRTMPPNRTGLECSFRVPRFGPDRHLDPKDPTALYRFFDQADTLLYVGISIDPLSRFHHHSKVQPWWPQVARGTTYWYPDRPVAAKKELAAYWREKPRYNSPLASTSQRGMTR